MKFPDARFKAWRKDAWEQIRVQRGRWRTMEGPGRATVTYTPGDLIARDVPGIMDAICHLLERCPCCDSREARKVCPAPIVRDDKFLRDWTFHTMPLNRKAPGALISITEYS